MKCTSRFKDNGLWYYFVIAIIFIVGLIFRWIFINHQAIFVDEAANLPGSILFFKAISSFPINYNVLISDPVKPEFYRILYGAIGTVFNGLKLPTITNFTYINYVQLRILLYERTGIVLINFVITLLVVNLLFKKDKLVAISFLTIYWLNPYIVFETSLVLTSSLVIPLSLLFLVFTATSKLDRRKSSIYVAALFGVMMSVQYYNIIFYAIPFIIFISNYKNYKLKDNIKIITRFYLTFTLFSLLIFFLLNPAFLINPILTLKYTLGSTASVLSTSSGVVNVPVYLLGGITYIVPIYTIFLLILFITPLPILFMFFFSIVFKRPFYHYSKENLTSDYIVRNSLLMLISLLFFILLFNHLRENYAIISIPIILLSSAGIVEVARILSPNTNTSLNHRGNTKHFKMTEKGQKIFTLIIIVIILLSMVGILSYSSNSLPTYSNVVSDVFGVGGQNLQGAWNSPQTDMNVGKYIAEHHLENSTILTLALTSMVVYYSPSNNYIQIWGPVNETTLGKLYKGDYIVVDEWYSQLWGNPIFENKTEFKILYSYYLPGGYSIFAKIR